MLTLLPPTTRRLRQNYTRYARLVVGQRADEADGDGLPFDVVQKAMMIREARSGAEKVDKKAAEQGELFG